MLKKNDRYWDKANVAIERIEMQAIKEEDTALNLYETGEMDVTRLTGTNVQKFKNREDFCRQVEPTTFFGLMNHDDPALSNLNIRKALMIGFDREAAHREDTRRRVRAGLRPGPAGDHAGSREPDLQGG